MKKFKLLLIVLLLASIAAAGYIAIDRLSPRSLVADVPSGDQEIAWLHNTTSTADWERFVAGAKRAKTQLSRQGIEIEVDESSAFAEESILPELTLRQPGIAGTIRIRWYKIDSEMKPEQWIEALAKRPTPPLAIIGGQSSDRARDIAKALKAQTSWADHPPLFLIPTATANLVVNPPATDPVDLHSLYPKRTFRFCFTNQQIAKAVIDFVWKKEELRPQKGTLPPLVYAARYADDPYSQDLYEQFRKVVIETPLPDLETRVGFIRPVEIPYSVGSLHRANPRESVWVESVLGDLTTVSNTRSLLVLPTVSASARRLLMSMASNAPMIGERIVVVTGDTIGINVVYRDGKLRWNVQQDLPIPIVFFAHNNPVDWDQGVQTLAPPSGTDDVLLNASIVRLLAKAAFDNKRLVGDSAALAQRLHAVEPGFFDSDGNRAGDSGEYVVWVKPNYVPKDSLGPRIAASGELSVWKRAEGAWEKIQTLSVPYDPKQPEPKCNNTEAVK
jgi:hypothetical protein